MYKTERNLSNNGHMLLYRPKSSDINPGVLLVADHGSGLTEEVEYHARKLAEKGIAALGMTYSCTVEGLNRKPPIVRTNFNLNRQKAEIAEGLTCLAGDGGVDKNRLGLVLFGTATLAVYSIGSSKLPEDSPKPPKVACAAFVYPVTDGELIYHGEDKDKILDDGQYSSKGAFNWQLELIDGNLKRRDEVRRFGNREGLRQLLKDFKPLVEIDRGLLHPDLVSKIIASENDPIISQDEIRKLHEALNGHDKASNVWYDVKGHFIPPDKYSRLLQSFFLNHLKHKH
jgi:hypothetical protein